MADELSTVRDYVGIRKTRNGFKERREAIKPLETELKRRTRVLYDIVQDLEGLFPTCCPLRQPPRSGAFVQLCWNAAQDLGRLERHRGRTSSAVRSGFPGRLRKAPCSRRDLQLLGLRFSSRSGSTDRQDGGTYEPSDGLGASSLEVSM